MPVQAQFGFTYNAFVSLFTLDSKLCLQAETQEQTVFTKYGELASRLWQAVELQEARVSSRVVQDSLSFQTCLADESLKKASHCLSYCNQDLFLPRTVCQLKLSKCGRAVIVRTHPPR